MFSPLSVCLFVSEQDYTKSTGQISMKLGARMCYGPWKKLIDLGADQGVDHLFNSSSFSKRIIHRSLWKKSVCEIWRLIEFKGIVALCWVDVCLKVKLKFSHTVQRGHPHTTEVITTNYRVDKYLFRYFSIVNSNKSTDLWGRHI